MFDLIPEVIWITGLPGSGKSTLAHSLKSLLTSQRIYCIVLDGDDLRVALEATGEYERDMRIALAKKYSRLAKLISDQGIRVIVSTVSLFHEVHLFNRQTIPNYLEVFLDYPIEKLLKGPRKKMYGGSSTNYLHEITPEFPLNPHLHLKASSDDERKVWPIELLSLVLSSKDGRGL